MALPRHVVRMNRALRSLRGSGRRPNATAQVQHMGTCEADLNGTCTCEPVIEVYVRNGKAVTVYGVDGDGNVSPKRA